MSGAGLPSGGNLNRPRIRRGGGIPSGGSLPSGGFLPRNHAEMYHSLLSMSHHDWENMREIAAQQRGFKGSGFWPEYPKERLQADGLHYDRIARIHHPSIAAKMVEHEALNEGSGFFKSLKHVMRIGVKGYDKLKSFIDPLLKHRDALESLPFIGGHAKRALDVAQFATTKLDPFVQSGKHLLNLNPTATSKPVVVDKANEVQSRKERLAAQQKRVNDIVKNVNQDQREQRETLFL